MTNQTVGSTDWMALAEDVKAKVLAAIDLADVEGVNNVAYRITGEILSLLKSFARVKALRARVAEAEFNEKFISGWLREPREHKEALRRQLKEAEEG